MAPARSLLLRATVPGLEAFLGGLRDAYAAADVGRLSSAYAEAFSYPGLALQLRALESVYPMRRLLELAVRVEQEIAAEGLAAASRWLLDTYASGWRCSMPLSTAHLLETEPMLVFGNHPSMLTPFLIAASVKRQDLRIISSSHVHRILPSYGVHSIPVELRPGTWREHYRRGGVRGALGRRLLTVVHGVQDADGARAANRRSLEFGAAHVATGGSLLIAPEGPSARSKAWHTGLGIIAQRILEQPAERAPLAVMYWEQNTSNRRVFARIGPGPIARTKRHVLYRRPVSISFSEPTALSELTGSSSDPQHITQRLRAQYCARFPRY